MIKLENDQYNMLLAVENHFESNPSIWTLNIPVSDIKTTFSDVVDQITAAATQQSINSAGATLSKTNLRKDLEEKGLFVSSVLSAYTSVTPGHEGLYKMVHFSKTAFMEFRDDALLVAIEKLNAGAMTVIEGLAPFGITQATLTELMAARDAFHDIMKTPREVTNSRKEATETIPILLDGTMDKLVSLMSPTQPNFVNIYFKDRKIHSIGTRTLSLAIYTRDASNYAPLDKAHLEVVGQNIKRISTEKGQNRIQNLREGNYTLSVNRIGFVPQMIPFMIVSGQTTVIHVDMESVLEGVAKGQSSKVAEELS